MFPRPQPGPLADPDRDSLSRPEALGVRRGGVHRVPTGGNGRDPFRTCRSGFPIIPRSTAMFNPQAYHNSRPDGFGVLEIAGTEAPEAPRRFSPLKRTDLAGVVTGPLAALRLTQTFAVAGAA